MAGERLNGEILVPGQAPSVSFINSVGPFAEAASVAVPTQTGVEVRVQGTPALQVHAAQFAAAMVGDWSHDPQEIAARAVAMAEELITQAGQRLEQLRAKERAEKAARGAT